MRGSGSREKFRHGSSEFLVILNGYSELPDGNEHREYSVSYLRADISTFYVPAILLYKPLPQDYMAIPGKYPRKHSLADCPT